MRKIKISTRIQNIRIEWSSVENEKEWQNIVLYEYVWNRRKYARTK